MVEINNNKYSRESFESYKYRLTFRFEIENEKHYSNIDIYTTDNDSERVKEILESKKYNKVKRITLLNKATKEQDDFASLFIEETLKDI